MAPDPGQRKKFSAKDHRKMLWILGILAAVGIFVELLIVLRQPNPYLFGGSIVGLLVLLVIIGMLMNRGRHGRLLKVVHAAYPGAPVIPAIGHREARRDAQLAGAGTLKRGRWIGSTLALAVLPDRVEVWVLDDLWPRWAIRRAGAEISVVRINTGNKWIGPQHSAPGIRVSDGERSVHCVPAYAGVLMYRLAYVERALRELGEDPANHIDA